MLETTVNFSKREFEAIFAEITHECKLNLSNNNCLKSYILPLDNNKFDYRELFLKLKANLGRYALSRNEYEKDKELAITKAIDRLRSVFENDAGSGGELGEILLYLFLEIVLGAPKLLSKTEIKQTKNQYNYNADAVHFYSFIDNKGKHNQLLLCESKIQNDKKNAVENAFSSIKNTLENRSYDLSLVSSELFKVVTNLEEDEYIKSLIFPNNTEDIKNNVVKETAIGLFIGYSFEHAKDLDSLSLREWTIHKQKSETKEICDMINEKIKSYGYSGYSFYVFLLPFNNAQKDRADIIQQLLLNGAYKHD